VALDTRRARRHLIAADPVMADLIRRAGPCRLGASRGDDPFFLLLRAIVSQQLSTRAAATIFGRLCALFPGEAPTPARLLALDDATLRGAGLSTNKTRFVRDLAARVRDGRLDLAALDATDDDDALEALTAVLGIGTWTAEIFLLFQLHRPDIFPVGDLGLLTAMQRQYRMRSRPTPKRALKVAEAWRPHRSVAAWYLWRSLEL
jgi:DNA-3-methyladenine glycosylase II